MLNLLLFSSQDYTAACYAGGQPEEKGCRSFGSAVQAVLRYLGSLGSGLDHPEVHPLCLKGRCTIPLEHYCKDYREVSVLLLAESTQNLGLRLQTAHSSVVRGICVLSSHGEQ